MSAWKPNREASAWVCWGITSVNGLRWKGWPFPSGKGCRMSRFGLVKTEHDPLTPVRSPA